MKLLIPGGAGYIGSHMIKYAQRHGHEVVVLDDFSTGHEWAVKDCEVLRVNLLDRDKLIQSLKGRYFDGVIHFAAKSLVGESVKSPDLYYRNNVIGTINLVNEMLENGIKNLVFSSTAAIFGNPLSDKIDEDHPKTPINPYGQSKLMVENMLRDICSAYDFNAICLRYFNAAGAYESGEIGEAHDPETHLAQAHLLGLTYMKENKGFSAFNLGNGNGFSVLDVIKSCERVLGNPIRYKMDLRREGDPAVLVADSLKATHTLGWKPKFKDLDEIIKSAWHWHGS